MRSPTKQRGAAAISFGATTAEKKATMPGDELVRAPLLEATHAMTVDAPPAHVWLALLQLGEPGRPLAVGSVIPDGPPGSAFFLVRQLERERSLVLHSDTHLPMLVPSSFRRFVSGVLSESYTLEPVGEGRTRLVRRMRARCAPAPFALVAIPLLVTCRELITARSILRDIERDAWRAKGSGAEPRPRWDEVDEASWESFPASDPPAWTTGKGHAEPS